MSLAGLREALVVQWGKGAGVASWGSQRVPEKDGAVVRKAGCEGQPPAAVAPPAPPVPSHHRFLRSQPGEAMKAAPADVSGLFSSH